MQPEEHAGVIRLLLCGDGGFSDAFEYHVSNTTRDEKAELACMAVFEEFLDQLPADAPMWVLSDLACIFAGSETYKGAYNKTCHRISKAIGKATRG